MNNTKRITVAACALFIMLGFIAGGVSELWDLEASTDTQDIPAAFTEETEVVEDVPESRYVLKIQDGIVVVFNETDMSRPIIVTDIYASSLRHFDREQLSTGLWANGDFELQSMLEDFSS